MGSVFCTFVLAENTAAFLDIILSKGVWCGCSSKRLLPASPAL